MKNIVLLFCAICIFSCSKEPVYGPQKLKNGQIVELFVGDRYGSDTDQLLRLPNKDEAQASLYSFTERKPGFTYKVKAKFVLAEEGLQDSPAYYFVFQSVVSQEKYTGNDSFTIQLIKSYIPGGPFIQLTKDGDKFFYVSDKIQLTFATDEVSKQLETIWQNADEIRKNPTISQNPKWKQVRATVKHDPNKFGEAYLVEKIEFL